MAELEDWKAEILGKTGGILKFIGVGIENPGDIRRRVYGEYRQKNWIDSDIDDKLRWLLEEEYRTYLKQSSQAGPTFLQNAERFVVDNPGKFPLIESMFPIQGVTSEVWTVLSVLESSLAQGRRTRAGGSLESHLEFLLKDSGYRVGFDFATQVEIGGQNPVRLDFLFPSDKSKLVSDPNNTVTCACMTTVNDRVRLAIQQLQPNTYRRVPTAHGAKQFASQMKNLKGRLDYATANQFKFVVLPDAVSEFDGHDTLMTYQEWFNELESIKDRLVKLS